MKGLKSIHLVGVGGISMSGIAKVLLELGYEVTGSDIRTTAVLERLRALGATIYVGHDHANLNGADVVVVSSAVPEDNPEILKARERSVPIIHRSEMLAKLMVKQRGIAVAGTHGKSTTTSMIALAMERGHLDPTVMIGGELNDIGGNAKLGKGKYFVAEADESDGSLVNLCPEIAVITNVEKEHLDFFRSEQHLLRTFRTFLDRLPEKGCAVVCTDCPNVRKLMRQSSARFVTYGFSKGAEFTACQCSFDQYRSRFELIHLGQPMGEVVLNVPGKHNILNALATIAVGREANLDFSILTKSLSQFRGVRRRFQRIAEVDDVLVIDDYAHHPSEVRATLEAARQGFKQHRILAVFQPHRFTRTKHLASDFGGAFSQADKVLVTEIYSALESPIEGVSGKLIADEIKKRDPRKPVSFLPKLEMVRDRLLSEVRSGDMILTMGAGDVRKVAEQVAAALAHRQVAPGSVSSMA